MQAFGHCYCCGGAFGYSVDAHPAGAPSACTPCRNRGGLCLHNVGARREYPPVVAHYSVPHGDATGAGDPLGCVWCLARGMEPRDMVRAGWKRRGG